MHRFSAEVAAVGSYVSCDDHFSYGNILLAARVMPRWPHECVCERKLSQEQGKLNEEVSLTS